MLKIEEGKWEGKTLNVASSWKGLENYIQPIINSFNITPNLALEFGVDYGYSLHILSQAFKKAKGVDGFVGDVHCGSSQGDHFYYDTVNRFKGIDNVEIVRSSFEEYIKTDNTFYDLIHVDIVHLYKETYECAEWCINHSNVVVLHDIYSFPDMNKVCEDLSKKYNLGYNNTINKYHGLGILYKL